MKVRLYGVFGPYFLLFGLNTEIYSVNLRVQSKYRKLQTRKTPNTDTFYAVQFVDISNKKNDILVQICHKSSAIFQVNNS